MIFSAGALGTNSLLLRAEGRSRGLPRLSDRLGHCVRTNSESLLEVVSVPRRKDDHVQGHRHQLALQTDEHSHLEMTRYGSGSGFFRLLLRAARARAAPASCRSSACWSPSSSSPLRTLRAWFVRDWAKHDDHLLYMRSAEGTLALRARPGFGGHDDASSSRASAPRRRSPRRRSSPFADRRRSRAASRCRRSTSRRFGIPTTAHILGGCCMGDSTETGVIDVHHRVFGYEGLYVDRRLDDLGEPGREPVAHDHGARRARDEPRSPRRPSSRRRRPRPPAPSGPRPDVPDHAAQAASPGQALHQHLVDLPRRTTICSGGVGAPGFGQGLKREPGEHPGLPRSGNRERTPRSALASARGPGSGGQ